MRNNLTIPKSSTSHTRRIQDYNVCYIKDNKKLVPAMPSHDLLSPNRGKRHIKPKTFENCVSTNIVIQSATVNTKCYQPITWKSVLYENSFPPKTIIEWNNLKDSLRRDNWRLQNSPPAPGLTSNHLSPTAHIPKGTTVYRVTQLYD